MTPRDELRELKKYVAELERHFLQAYLSSQPLGQPTRSEILGVGAYVVLAHGAFENFIEGIALWLVDRIETQWKLRKRANRCTSSLLLFQSAAELDGDKHVTTYDNLRVALESAKTIHSKAVRDNNGITLSHVRELFYPLGVDVPNDLTLTASLEKLVSMRHEWAHQYRYGAKVARSARDAKIAVDDCLIFANRLSSEASTVRP